MEVVALQGRYREGSGIQEIVKCIIINQFQCKQTSKKNYWILTNVGQNMQNKIKERIPEKGRKPKKGNKLNIHAPTENTEKKDDEIKDAFYAEIESILD